MRVLGACAAVFVLGVACTSTHSAAKAPASTTTEVSSTTAATSTTVARPTPTTLRPPTSTTIAVLPPRQCCSTTPGGPLKVTFAGLTQGQRIPNDGTVAAFTVTYANATTTDYSTVAPVVAAEHYDGVPGPLSIVHGSLERYNPGTGAWDQLALGEGTGMDFMYSGDSAAFRCRGAAL